MFKHILVPIDGTELSSSTAQKAIAFAAENGAEITFLHAMSEPHVPLSDTEHYEPERSQRSADAAQRRATAMLDAAVAQAKQAGVTSDGVSEANDSPYVAIVRVASELACDLIFMASHGRRGLNALLLGSETQKVLTHCKTPVLVYR